MNGIEIALLMIPIGGIVGIILASLVAISEPRDKDYEKSHKK